MAILAIVWGAFLQLSPVWGLALLGGIPLFLACTYGGYRAGFESRGRAFWAGFAAVGLLVFASATVFHDSLWSLFLTHLYPRLCPGVAADPEHLIKDASGLTIPFLWWRDPMSPRTLRLITWPELRGAFAVHAALLLLAGLAVMSAGGLLGYLIWSTGDYLVRQATGGSSTGAEVGTPARDGRVIEGEGTR